MNRKNAEWAAKHRRNAKKWECNKCHKIFNNLYDVKNNPCNCKDNDFLKLKKENDMMVKENHYEMAIEEEDNGVRIHWKDNQWLLPGLQTEQIGDVSTVGDVLSITMKFGSTIRFRADGFVKEIG